MPPLTNTLESARKLEEASFSGKQAEAVAQVVETATTAAQQDLKSFIKEQNQILEERLTAYIDVKLAQMEVKFSEIDVKLAQMEVKIAQVDVKIAQQGEKFADALRAQTFSILALMCALVAGIVALWKLFPNP